MIVRMLCCFFGLLCCTVCFVSKGVWSADKIRLKIEVNDVEDPLENSFCDIVELKLIFDVTDEFRTIIDTRSISHDCRYPVADSSKIASIEQLGLIKDTGFIIENSKKEFRRFDNFKDGINRPTVYSCYLMNPKKIENSGLVKFTWLICLQDLTNNEHDQQVRLHYILKLSEEDKSKGYQDFTAVSNWIAL